MPFFDTYEVRGIATLDGHLLVGTRKALFIEQEGRFKEVLKKDIWDLSVVVNIISTYSISEHQRNKAILLSGNEIKSLSQNLFNFNLATGMIIKISGSSYNENNKEYNIISLDEYSMSLSYQGTFISESNVYIYGKTRG